MAPEDWEGDAAGLLEYESIHRTAKESASNLDAAEGPIDLDFKSHHAEKLRNLVSFFMWSHTMIMGTVHLLWARKLVAEEYNQNQVADFLRDETVSDRFLLDMLREAEVIGTDLHSNLNRVRKIRNEMAHSIRSRALLKSNHLDTNALEAEVNRANRAYNDVQDLL